jgi:hypothetical protein
VSRINTNTLLKRLFKAEDLDSYLESNALCLGTPDFCALLKSHCERKGLLPAHVIERSQIERTYGHQLFNGTRRPSRDKVILLALGLGLDVDETQQLLRAAGKSLLYPRLKRDAVILFAVRNRLPVISVQETLTKYGLTMLGGQKSGNE